MTNWFDLPAEVKHIIFSYIPESESVIYVPRDRRRKVDRKYLNSYHFHDLLLVSKAFITAEDFAFAVLASASLKFHSYNELRRFVAEVKPAVREAVRSLTFVRHLVADLTGPVYNWSDGFDGFSNISKTLSFQFPDLRRINIITVPFCAELAHISRIYDPLPGDFNQMMTCILEYAERGVPPLRRDPDLTVFRSTLQHAMASCIANRNTRILNFAWTRPHPWLRRLVLYAEVAEIEVVFDINLCITGYFDLLTGDEQDIVPRVIKGLCFHRHHYRDVGSGLIRVKSSVSTKDYMLRIKHDDIEYKFRQQIGYEMLHTPASKGLLWWMSLLKPLEYPSQPHCYAF